MLCVFPQFKYEASAVILFWKVKDPQKSLKGRSFFKAHSYCFSSAFSSLSASDSHVDPVTHTVLYHKLMQACKWLNLDIISSSSLTVALISFDVTHNHLVRAPAATAPPPQMLRCKSSEMFWGRLAHNLNYKETFIYLFYYSSFLLVFLGKAAGMSPS